MNSLSDLLNAIAHDKANLNINELSADFIDFSVAAGVGPYLKYCSSEFSSIVKKENLDTLLSADLTAKIITQSMINSLNEIFTLPNMHSIKIILLKGIAVGQQYYPKPWLRIMSDIDLLIAEKDIPEFEKALESLGYKQTSNNPLEFYNKHHHGMPFYNEDTNLWIEVHTHLFSDTSKSKLDNIFKLENINKNTIEVPDNNVNIRQLSPEMQLIYTCVHWAEDYHTYKGCIQLIDVINLIKNNHKGLEWSRITDYIQNTASASSVYLVLSYLEKANALPFGVNPINKSLLKYNNMSIVNVYILHTIIKLYLTGGHKYNKFFNENNIKIIWKTLLRPRNSFINILFIPYNILFPITNKKRFSIIFMLNRIFKLFK